MRVFLHANILFSAAKSDGAVRALLHLLVDGGHECRVDDYVVIEARRNLAAREPDAVGALETLLKRLRCSPAQAPGPGLKSVNWLPEKDRAVLAAAMRLRCAGHGRSHAFWSGLRQDVRWRNHPLAAITG